MATGIFSALGDSRTPFIFLACSSLSNIGADILFVTAFGMKVDGVAWATFLCQGVSCVLAIIFVLRRFRRFETPEKAPVFSWRLLGRIATVAIPSILQQSFISVGNIVIQSVINGFGTATIAGLLRLGQTQQSGHHLADYAWQRRFQFHRAESGRGASMTASGLASGQGYELVWMRVRCRWSRCTCLPARPLV